MKNQETALFDRNKDYENYLADFNWSGTEMGSVKFWSEAMVTMSQTCLMSNSPMAILWGADFIQVYNEAFRNIIGKIHPPLTGARAQEVWKDDWQEMAPLLQNVLELGTSFTLKDFSFSAVYNKDKKIEGILVLASHSTPLSSLKNRSDVITNTSQLPATGIGINASAKAPQGLPGSFVVDREMSYHKMIDEVQDYAIILLDKNGIIQNWNKGAQKIKQYKEHEIVGKPFQVFYLPNDRESKLPEKLMHEAKVSGKAVHEGWRVRKDQTVFWGSVTLTALHGEDNEVIGFTKVTRDLTDKKMADDQLKEFALELKEANEALVKSEDRYHKMISEVEDYAIIFLNENGDIENWNLGAQKIKGYSSEEIIGKHFSTFYTPEDRERNLPQQLLAEAISQGKAVKEGWRLRKDGSKFWGSIVLTALHSDDGSIIGFSKVTRDLTERKHAEDKINEYVRELQAQNKELEQFAYVASHDLQEPLRKIQTYSSVIQRKLSNNEDITRELDKINHSAKRMSDLIKAVLNYSRLTSEDNAFVLTDLNLIIKNIQTDFELLIEEKGASIYSEDLPSIQAIPSQVNQLFANLINNALKFCQMPPVIEIRCRYVSMNHIVNIPEHNLLAPHQLEISFVDNGIGFDQHYEARIFVMFQRLHGKNEYSGTGIGLALCKKIMDVHNGYITVKSTPGKGSTFYLYFPVEWESNPQI